MRAVALFLVCATAAGATADGPDAWRVTGVAADDVLNLRAGPATDWPVIARLGPDARGVTATACIPTLTFGQWEALGPDARAALQAKGRWCLLTGPDGATGWGNMRYLQEDGE